MTTAKLHTYNDCDEIPVRMMVGKAMCAYSNWQSVEDDRDHLSSLYGSELVEKSAIAHKSEYEATIRCIDMFVKDGLYAIQDYVTGRAKDEFGI